jgi:hypothetical protein
LIDRRRYERFSAAFALTVALLGDESELRELEVEQPYPPGVLLYHRAMHHFAIGMVRARLAAVR